MVRARRILAAGLALVTASIAIAGIFVVKFSADAARSRGAVLHSMEVARAIQALSAKLADAETGQRGYILTQRAGYLAPYEAAVKTLPGAMTVLRATIQRDVDAGPQLAALDGLVQAKLAELATTIDGRELARQARELLPGLQALFTSGYTENAIIHHGRIDRGVELLSKPYRQDELARKLRLLLKRRAMRPQPGAAAASRPGLHVLVVEDDALVRMATVDMIEELGHRADQADTGEKALALIEQSPDLDVLLTDIGLPGMDGRELARTARRLRPGLGIVLAGYDDDAAPRPDDADARTVHLGKPYHIHNVQQAFGRLTEPQRATPQPPE